MLIDKKSFYLLVLNYLNRKIIYYKYCSFIILFKLFYIIFIINNIINYNIIQISKVINSYNVLLIDLFIYLIL